MDAHASKILDMVTCLECPQCLMSDPFVFVLVSGDNMVVRKVFPSSIITDENWGSLIEPFIRHRIMFWINGIVIGSWIC